MCKIEGIQKYLREEIKLTEKKIEEKAKAKYYNDAALLQARKEGLDWAWNLIAAFSVNSCKG